MIMQMIPAINCVQRSRSIDELVLLSIIPSLAC